MKQLLHYLSEYKKECVLAPLFKMLEALFELFVPLVMAAIIDVGIANKDTSYIIKMCLVLVALGLIGLVCAITAQYFSAKAAVGFSTGVRHALFAHIQKLGYAEMDTIGTSTLITRMTSDVNQIQQGINLTLRLFMRSPFVVFGAMIMAFTVDVKAAIIFVIVIPVLAVIVFGIILSTAPLYKKVQNNLDQVTLVTRENLGGVRVIRAFNKEESEITRFENATQVLADSQKYVGRISGLMNPMTYVVVNLAMVVLIYAGALHVEAGVITQGAVVALVNYMSQILVELVKLANLIITITKAVACGNRVQGIFEVKNAMQDGTYEWKEAEGEPIISFDHVDLTYSGAGAESLRDITFKAYKGQTIGIIGGTGSGKSSVVNLIPRFYDATDGSVSIYGRNVKEIQTKSIREHISVVPQKAALFKGTIESNLRWGNENATTEELEEALRISQAKEFVDKKEGLSSIIEQNGRNLSGGQKQRLTIARALVKKPEILILDDSASALDFATDAALRREIRGMDPSPTVFIVSQRASSILYADQILVMDEGSLVAAGTHEELLAGCEVYQEIYYSQFPSNEQEVNA